VIRPRPKCSGPLHGVQDETMGCRKNLPRKRTKDKIGKKTIDT